MGVYQWAEHGKKNGYWEYFKKEARKELAAEMLEEMEKVQAETPIDAEITKDNNRAVYQIPYDMVDIREYAHTYYDPKIHGGSSGIYAGPYTGIGALVMGYPSPAAGCMTLSSESVLKDTLYRIGKDLMQRGLLEISYEPGTPSMPTNMKQVKVRLRVVRPSTKS